MSYQFIKSKQLLKLPVVLLFLLVSSLQLMAQTNVVTGTVTDPLGEPDRCECSPERQPDRWNHYRYGW